MQIADAQREVRLATLGGFAGQLVSGLIWLGSATVTTFVQPRAGFWTLAIAGAGIFPLTTLINQSLLGRPNLSRTNPFRYLAMQIAFTVPLVLPLAGVAALLDLGLFYPACLIIVGAHYLPFIFLYGMRTFAALAAIFIGAGMVIGKMAQERVALGGWVGGGVLVVFAFVLLAENQQLARSNERQGELGV